MNVSLFRKLIWQMVDGEDKLWVHVLQLIIETLIHGNQRDLFLDMVDGRDKLWLKLWIFLEMVLSTELEKGTCHFGSINVLVVLAF